MSVAPADPVRAAAASSAAAPLVDVANLVFSYGKRTILDGITLTVPRGKVVAIMGGSGSGKTTLLRLIGGQLKPTQGTLTVAGENVAGLGDTALYRLRRRMGMLFQFGALFTDLSVFDNVAFPLREHTDLPESMIRDLVLMKLQAVGLRGARDLMPSEVSGGMARRVAIARAIALDPMLVMYDEPFTGLDPISLGVIANLIRRLNDALGATSIVVTHDVHASLEMVDYVYFVSKGRIEAQGTPDEIRASTVPFVHQFVHGEMDGPVPFHYPSAALGADLGVGAAAERTEMAGVLAQGISRVGAWAVDSVWRMGVLARFFWSTLRYSGASFRRFRMTVKQVNFLGNYSLVIIAVSGLFVGFVLGLQGYNTLQRYGSEQALGVLVALSLVRELGPVVTALLFAGRAGTALTAEIGLMKATEQLSAMEMMAVNPFARVIAPRFWAGVISMPLLAAIFSIVGVYGGYFVGVVLIGIDEGAFWAQMRASVDVFDDVLNGVLKSFVFGIAVTLIALFEGYDAQPTAEGVSRATTRTVVVSSLAVLALDFVLTSFMLGGGGW